MIKCIFYECWEKNLKHFAEKSHSVFEGFKGGTLEHTKPFFSAKCFLNFYSLSIFMKNTFATNQKKNQKNMHVIERKEILTARS